ncbi:MAG: hypothetical protein WDO73_00355 [Ignavibacteriota bacterium]
MINAADFYVPSIAPGTLGVPTDVNASGAQDTFETGFGGTGRNIFRGPDQKRIDFSVAKTVRNRRKVCRPPRRRRLQPDQQSELRRATTNASQYSVRSGQVPTVVALPASFGLIQHTIGSPRFMQLSLTFAF